MTARNFIVPGNHAFNSNGLAVPGATATLYGSGTTTPAAFYSDSALSVSLGSTITANGIGRFPVAYGSDATAYRLILKDRDGAELDGGDIDPFYFGQTIITVTSAGAIPEIDGALGDGTTNDAVALQAWLDRGGSLRLPVNEYYSADNLILRKNAVIEGEGYGFDSRTVDATADLGYDDQPGAKIRFAVGKGFIIQPQTTVTDPAGVLTAIQEGARHSIIRNLALVGAGTGASVTGLYCRTTIHLDNVHCMKFQGKGFDISATLAVDGVAEYGDASGSTLTRCRSIYNGSHGFHVRGNDTNVIKLDSCYSQLNGGWGFLDEGFLGNEYINCLAATNTSGGFKGRGTNADHTFTGCYVETGTGNNCDIGKECVVIGGNLATLAMSTSNAAALLPQVIGNGTANFNYAKFTSAWGNLGAITGSAYAYRHASQGIVLHGEGATNDVSLKNKSDTLVAYITTGTTTFRTAGQLWTDINITVNGASAHPGLIATQGVLFNSVTNGLTVSGFGSTYDSTLANKTNGVALGVLTGTVNVVAGGSVAATGAVTGSNLSGTNTGDQYASTTASRLIGRGSAAGAGAAQEITLGTGLSMSGTTLSGSAGGPSLGLVSAIAAGLISN